MGPTSRGKATVLFGMAAFSLLRSRDDGRPGGCRSCLSGLPEDLHGSLSSSSFHQIEKTGVGIRWMYFLDT